MTYTLGNNIGEQTIADNARQGIQLRYDAKSFIIGEKRVFLNIASIHYFRMPRQEWREVLVKAKLAGMNCIDTYFAWNVHEPEEGKWDFSGDNDCGAFLDLCSELGLWVIARPGPFICAEWDFGGFPYWLKNKKNIQFRTDNETYLRYVYRYFDQIVPIIRSRQMTKDGTVILVQVENEYGYLAEDASGLSYMKGLRDGLLDRGIDVPLITCEGGLEGTIEGANFWSGADSHYGKLMRKQPDVPKLVTEFWTGWFEHWGAPAATQKTPDLYEKRMMESIRAGFDGISHYMFFGGTNFGGYGGRTVGSSDIYMVTSYDYDAPLSEYGRVTAKYRMAKKVSLFTLALGQFLLESEPMDNFEARCGEGARLQGRQWNGQKLWFAESIKQEKEMFQITLESGRTLPVSIKPGQIVPILDRIEICPGLKLTCGGFLIGNDLIGEVQTIVLAGDDGGRTHIVFEADQSIHFDNAGHIPHESSLDGRTLRLDVYHFQASQRIKVNVGGQLIELIALNGYMSDRAWRLHGDGVRWAIGWEDMDLGADGSVSGVSGGCDSEPFLLGDWGHKEGIGQDQISRTTVRGAGNAIKPLLSPSLSEWKRNTVNLLSLGGGEQAERPRGFAELGLAFGYLIYSSEIECDWEQENTLVFSAIQDSARLFVNGLEQAIIRQVGAVSANMRLSKGRNKIQLLVQHMGSLNFSPNLGEEKGIFGPVYLDGSTVELRRDWYCGEEAVHLDEVHNSPFASTLSRSFELAGNDGAILVGALSSGLRINGKEVPMDGYQNWFAYHAVDISGYVVNGSNTIEMPVSRTPLNRLELLTYNRSRELKNWSAIQLDEATEFVEGSAAIETGPAWYRSMFDLPAIPEDVNPKLKLRMTGMSKGYLLLNGRNLGRYWQIGPQEDYKIPMAWLKETSNELILFDEEGRRPDSVRIFFDMQSERRWQTLNEA
ncbi:beta-galactosidase [Paenibacillus sp. LPE1-1-1.1]|uniref:beta-galactosidase n=1 Tax=Paenibacillus sp. LPE1-1-1.1 TaxID=3135230 RepID=UPI00344540A8